MRQRLCAAALTLYGENGFEQTTAADIAVLAGVTERTYFRHFPDKREVLFDGQTELQAALVQAVQATAAAAVTGPGPAVAPLEVLHRAFASLSAVFEADRDLQRVRRRIIDANPDLAERGTVKVARLTAAITAALTQHGVEARTAELAAACAMAALGQARSAWLLGSARPYERLLAEAFDDLGAVLRAPNTSHIAKTFTRVDLEA